MEEIVKTVFRNIFQLNDVESNKYNQENIENWDSLNHLRLIIAIEQKFYISIEPEESVNIKSYSDIITLLKQKTNGSNYN